MQLTGGFTFNGGLNFIAQAISNATDPYFQYVTMLLQGEGTNGAQNGAVLDSSTNNFSVTRSGDVTQGTYSPFSKSAGRWGTQLSNSSNITWPSDITATGSQDFCCEVWAYITGSNPSQTYGIIFSGSNIFGSGGNTGNLQFSVTNAGAMGMVMEGFLATASAPDGTVKFNQWNHLVWCRTGTTSAMFVNGTRVSSGTSSYGATFRYFNGYSNYQCQGFFSNARIVVGSNPYPATSSTLTVPTNPLTAITNTKLLICQDYTLKDNSSVPYSLTSTSVTVTTFSPFVDTNSYSASINGGSYSFDGTGDYLSVANNSAFAFGSGNWTIEFWINPTSFAGFNVLVSYGYNQAGNVRSFIVYINQTTGLLRLAQSSNGSDNTDSSTGITLNLNVWQHVAIVRNGANITSYLNGVSSGTNISAVSLFSTSTALTIGTQNDLVNYFTGYLSSLRLVKGSAVYTSNFTPPTAPLTNIANTSLLLSGTNAGVIDSAKSSDIVLRGNAQASTTQAKFGSSSIYFDGINSFLVANPVLTDLYAFGSGDFTIEFWMYINNISGTYILYDSRNAANGALPTLYSVGSNLYYYVNTADRITGTGALSGNTWQHIAVCRSGSSTKMFVNGNQVGSTYTDNTVYINSAGRPLFGINTNLTSNPFDGYIDDLRVTKGFARYTANFTPPTTSFPSN